MEKYFILLLVAVLCTGICFGQVANDHIENRLNLELNAAPYTSNTTGCTVERSCVSEALQDNCIKFHNDQWFEFTTTQAGTYYLNVSGQDCRDIRGVQLLVLDGVPCQPETYTLINCVSTATQDDIYLQLDSLKANYTYLLNVDGYLHDFCQFTIAFSDRPQGIPAKANPIDNRLITQLREQVLHYNWNVTADQAQEFISYTLLRQHAHESRFRAVWKVPHQRDSYGHSVTAYSGTDTLAIPGTVVYKLMAERTDGALVQLGEQQYTHTFFPPKPQPGNQEVLLQLDYKAGTPLSIYVFQATTKQVLKTSSLVADKRNKQLRIATRPYKELGISQIEVKITDHKRKESRSYYFDI